MNWSGGFQWNFTTNWLLETTYQGSRGVRLLNAWDINQIPLDISNDPNVLRTIFQAQQNYKPYPQFGPFDTTRITETTLITGSPYAGRNVHHLAAVLALQGMGGVRERALYPSLGHEQPVQES